MNRSTASLTRVMSFGRLTWSTSPIVVHWRLLLGKGDRKKVFKCSWNRWERSEPRKMQDSRAQIQRQQTLVTLRIRQLPTKARRSAAHDHIANPCIGKLVWNGLLCKICALIFHWMRHPARWRENRRHILAWMPRRNQAYWVITNLVLGSIAYTNLPVTATFSR